MRHALKRHPGTASAARKIEVEVARAGPGRLILHYFVSGRIDSISWPPPATPAREDELWKRTCFEAFLKPAPGPSYLEFNFSPSTRWAAYHFQAYRQGMEPADLAREPLIDTGASEACYRLKAVLDLSSCDGVDPDGGLDLGLSAVLDEADGSRSYWALDHAPGEPDFHHDHCFAHRLAAATGT